MPGRSLVSSPEAAGGSLTLVGGSFILKHAARCVAVAVATAVVDCLYVEILHILCIIISDIQWRERVPKWATVITVSGVLIIIDVAFEAASR